MRAQSRHAKPFFALPLAMLLFDFGCVKIPQHNFNAPPPPVAPAPPVQSSATVTFEGISSAPVGTALIAGLPRAINAQQFPGGCANPCYHFALQTFDAVLSNGRLVMSPSYRGDAQVKAGAFPLPPVECDLDPVSVNINLSARPVIKHDANRWSLSLADVQVQPSIGPGSDTHCVIFNLFNAGGILQGKLNDLSGSIKSKIEALSFPIPIDDLAQKLLGPISIPTKGGTKLCVYPRVTDLQIGTIGASPGAFENAIFVLNPPPIKTSLPNVLQVPLSFLGAPSVVATKGACPAPQPVGGSIQLADGAGQLPFKLLASVAADYVALSDAASATLKPIQGHWGLLKLTFKPSRLQLGNANGRIFAALSVAGSLSGTVFFWGTPAVSESEDGEIVSLPDLQLAAESRVALSSKDERLPDFIANMFKKPIQDAFEVNIKQLLPQANSMQPISFPLPNNGILQLGPLNVTIDSVKSVEGQLQANVLIECPPIFCDASAHNP